MNNKIKIIVGVLILLNLFLLYNTIKLKSVTKMDDSVRSYIKLTPLEFALYDSYITNGKSIPEIKLQNVMKENVDIKNLIKNKKTIIIVYSEVSCNSCTDSLINGCNKLFDKSNDSVQVFGVAYTDNIEYLRRFVRINEIKFPFLWDEEKLFIEQLKLNALPVVLMANKNGEIINSFFINPSIHDLNPTFFKVANKFIEN